MLLFIFLFFLIWSLLLPLAGVFLFGTSFNFSERFSSDAILLTSAEKLPLQPYSSLATVGIALFGLSIGLSIVFLLFRGLKKAGKSKIITWNFPWWGYVAILSLSFFWLIAWERPLQLQILHPIAFSGLWFSYIVLVNAVVFYRSGKCLLTDNPKFLVILYFVSIPFWWYFEYLNRFVFNWYYLYDKPDAVIQYHLFGSIAFGTVLPAVLSTRDFLLTFSSVRLGFDDLPPIKPNSPLVLGIFGFFLSSVCLALLGVFPKILFLFLWMAPLFLLISLQTIWRNDHIFIPVGKGNYTQLAAAALAALICGVLWELWNAYSLPKWIYTVPWVGQFKIFEMPVIGFLGYLPFGLECLAIEQLITRWTKRT